MPESSDSGAEPRAIYGEATMRLFYQIRKGGRSKGIDQTTPVQQADDSTLRPIPLGSRPLRKIAKRMLFSIAFGLLKAPHLWGRLGARKGHSLKFLIIQLHYLGDVIITTPVLYILKRHFPQAEIHYWINVRSMNILRHCPEVDAFYVDRSKITNFNNPITVIDKFISNFGNILAMRREHFSFVIDYSANFVTALMSNLLCASKTIGLAVDPVFKYAYDICVIRTHEGEKLLREYYLDVLNIAGILNCNGGEAPYRIYLSEEERRKARDILACRIGSAIVMAPFAGWQTKEWPIENFAALAERLVNLPATVYVVGAAAEVERAACFRRENNSRIIPLLGVTTSLESAAVIEQADLFVGLDSSMSYVAEAFGVPSVVIFGSTNSSLLVPESNPRLKVIRKLLSCSPKGKQLFCGDNTTVYRCPYGKICTRLISVDEVYLAALELLRFAYKQ